ncbi:hypothetical protein [Porphyromonas macacae]|uniref:Uncharacterized protein n=1 Tax=Porphyromonas macacae TaxID=28115 RepID=A0A379DH06_9PORP|nr:hypothetical protein [Porphyromonas macacae]SUB77659.1 Uncharacterised protein [Porphyromonas macacae]
MEQRDLIRDLAEETGRTIGKALVMLLRLKQKGSEQEAVVVTNGWLKQELGLDTNRLIELSDRESEQYISQYCTTADHLTEFSQYLIDVAVILSESDRERSVKMLERAGGLLTMADLWGKELSVRRIRLKGLISQLLASDLKDVVDCDKTII